MERPETLYVRSGDAYLGYQTFGSGSFAILSVPGRVSNVELMWDRPELAEFYGGLAQFSRVVVFDRRGVGVSDRPAGGATLEQQVDDLRTVMDAAAVERACLLGSRDGAALAAMFAGVHPARVVCLLLWQPHVRGAWAPDYPWGLKESEMRPVGAEYTSAEAIDQAMRFQFPSKIGDAEFRRRFIQTLRLSASPSSYAALRRVWLDSDVRHILGSIQAPTLVMHGSLMDVNESRYVAERIPLATLLEFPEVKAIGPVWGDAERPIRAMHAFISDVWDDAERPFRPDRVLATVLFTDLVGSTEQSVALGPDWQELLRQHNSAIRRELAQFRGREIDSAGDGFFASGFEGPAQAIRCGCAIRDAIDALGLRIRVGVHTGECDIVDGKLAGVAVAIGARVAAQAASGEVIVSGAVRDLVAGSGIEFEARGIRELKGVGDWALYSVATA